LEAVKNDDIRILRNLKISSHGIISTMDSKQSVDIGDAVTYIFLHETCLRLVSALTPLEPVKLWNLFRIRNTKEYYVSAATLCGVDYGEMVYAVDQYVNPWFGLSGLGDEPSFADIENSAHPKAALRSLLLRKAEMWVFVAPDR
jgi:hypothetical protein